MGRLAQRFASQQQQQQTSLEDAKDVETTKSSRASFIVNEIQDRLDKLMEGNASDQDLDSSELSIDSNEYDINNWHWDLAKLDAEDNALTISSPLSSSSKSSRRSSMMTKSRKSLTDVSVMESEPDDIQYDDQDEFSQDHESNIYDKTIEMSIQQDSPVKSKKSPPKTIVETHPRSILKSRSLNMPSSVGVGSNSIATDMMTNDSFNMGLSVSQRVGGMETDLSLDHSLDHEIPSDDIPGDDPMPEFDQNDDGEVGDDDEVTEDENSVQEAEQQSDSEVDTEGDDSEAIPAVLQRTPIIVKSKAMKKKQEKQLRSSLSKIDRKAKRRQTLVLVDEAKQAGFVSDDTFEDDDGEPHLRRSKRKRTQPLKFWKNERHIYRRSNKGLGAVLPVTEVDFTRSDDDEEFTKTSRKKRTKSKKSSKNASDTMVDINRKNKSILHTIDEEGEQSNCIVGVSQGCLEFQNLGDESNPSSVIQAAKCFDTHEFTNGVIIIPPGHYKEEERIVVPEVFQVNVCSNNSLTVRINDSTFKFSTGDNFWIPSGSVYSLKNESKTNPIELSFFVSNYEVMPPSVSYSSKKKKSKNR